jgi:hypothetical protein
LFLGSIIMTRYFQWFAWRFYFDSNLGDEFLQIRKSNEITLLEARYIMLLKKSCICLF